VLRSAPARDIALRAVQLAQSTHPHIEIRADVAVDAIVQCAPPLLVQVLSNLLENAAHAVGRGGWIELALRVDVSRGEPRVQFIVTDSGPGVPRELRDRIFEPFFTTKPAGAGTGLGLSLAREIVQHHDGALELRELASRHAFVVELPIHDVHLATSSVVQTGSASRP
jgi:two-component system NtrC family sensor kinase